MLEKILHFSLTQRFLVILGVLAIVGIGIVSVKNLTLDAVPDISTNQVIVNTKTPGMAPAEVEKLVTFPVETAMGGVPGVQQVRSLSQYGLSQVIVTFADGSNIYFNRQLISEGLSSVREQLPPSVEAPEMGPVTTGLGEIYMYSVESDKRSPMDLRTLQDWMINPQLRTVAGVAGVDTLGGSEKQYEVRLDPQRLQAHNVSLRQVMDAIQKNNANAGGGFSERNSEQTIIRSVGVVTSTNDIVSIVVDSQGGTPIYLKDVADVGIGTPLRTGVATKDGKEAIIGTVLMLKGGNGRSVSQAVDERMKAIRSQLPKDVTLTTVYNRTDLVNQTVHTVQKSLLEGAALIVFVLLLLGNIRAALIVAVLIPLSMLLAATGMNRFGISGNLLSLGAIDFGLIVDGGVFMVENIVRRLAEERRHQGRTLTRAEVQHMVWEGAREVATPVTFSVLIITVVYLPILALEGTEGKMFQPMAYTVVFALLGALLLTLTLTPALCAMFLSGDTKEKHNPIMAFFNRVYRPVLDFSLRARLPIAAGAVVILLGAGLLFTRLGSEFIPQLDEGSLVIQPVRLRTVSTGETIRMVTQMEKAIKTIPEVTTVFCKSGTAEVASDPMPVSLTDGYIMLKPHDKWRPGLTKEKLIEQIQNKVETTVPGQGYGFSQPIQLRFSELIADVKSDIGIKVFGEDLNTLKQKADEVAEVVRKIPGAQDVQVEQVDDVPVLQIVIDRQAIARVGVNVSDIQDWVQTAIGGQPLGQVIEGDRRFEIAMRLPESTRGNPEALKALPIATPGGGSVTLGSLATLKMVPAPAQISRDHGKRRVVVQLNVRGADLGTFVPQAQAAIAQKVRMPEGYYLEWGGQYENLQRAQARLAVVVPLALGLIFVLLFFTFGSVKQSLLIFSGVPLAITGGILGLWLRGLPFSISAGVGFIALSGVAVLNGVVMVSAINGLRKQGKTVDQAVREGAQTRLRPILMTALVAALGFLPMALNTGVGAEVQKPLATVVIGGIASATLLTLIVLPILYTWFERETKERETKDVDVTPQTLPTHFQEAKSVPHHP